MHHVSVTRECSHHLNRKWQCPLVAGGGGSPRGHAGVVSCLKPDTFLLMHPSIKGGTDINVDLESTLCLAYVYVEWFAFLPVNKA